MINKAEARRIQTEIRDVLIDIWDPIGVKDFAPRDEYDSYIGKIYGLLRGGATDQQIAAELLGIEIELGLGLPQPGSTDTNIQQTVAALRRLKLPELSK